MAFYDIFSLNYSSILLNKHIHTTYYMYKGTTTGTVTDMYNDINNCVSISVHQHV